MLIGGLQKISLLDYPGRISAIVFTKGCNFRCRFCYNPMLVEPIALGKFPNIDEKNHSLIKEDDFFRWLESRVNRLEAVVITGGEPTIQRDLFEFVKKIKNLGFKVKLDTNGTNPEVLAKLIKAKLVDYIAMDIKTNEEKYKQITQVEVDFKNIKKSVKMIMESKLPYEFRTTLVPTLTSKEDIAEIGALIKGAKNWYLQGIKIDTDLVNNEVKQIKPYSREELKNIQAEAARFVKKCELR